MSKMIVRFLSFCFAGTLSIFFSTYYAIADEAYSSSLDPEMLEITQELSDGLAALYDTYREELTETEYDLYSSFVKPLEISADKDYGLKKSDDWSALQNDIENCSDIDKFRIILHNSYIGINETTSGMPSRIDVVNQTQKVLSLAGFSDAARQQLRLSDPAKAKNILWTVTAIREEGGIAFEAILNFDRSLDIRSLQYHPEINTLLEIGDLEQSHLDRIQTIAYEFAQKFVYSSFSIDRRNIQVSPWVYDGWPGDPLSMVWVLGYSIDDNAKEGQDVSETLQDRSIGARLLIGIETGRIYHCQSGIAKLTFDAEMHAFHEWRNAHGGQVDEAGGYRNFVLQGNGDIAIPHLSDE